MAKPKTKPLTWRDWVSGARLRTLPLAVGPVLLGFGLAHVVQTENYLLAALALLVSLFLQIGVNYSNDYSDGVRGTDDYRVGPTRITASGRTDAKNVRNVAFIFFGLAALAGLAIILITTMWWLLGVGAASVLAAWFYTGGKRPYGYAGLGEIFVFIFFGLVATCGTVAIQDKNFFANGNYVFSLGAAIAMGFFAAAVLMVNNIRDIETDRKAGKKTLAARIGIRWSKALYILFIWIPMFLAAPYALILPRAGFAFFVVLLVAPLTLIVATAKTPREYITALKLTSYASLAYAILLTYGLVVIG